MDTLEHKWWIFNNWLNLRGFLKIRLEKKNYQNKYTKSISH